MSLARSDLPKGYVPVEWADGVVHVINLDDWDKPGNTDRPLWRIGVLCDSSGPGVSSDEGGKYALNDPTEVDCWQCLSIIS